MIRIFLRKELLEFPEYSKSRFNLNHKWFQFQCVVFCVVFILYIEQNPLRWILVFQTGWIYQLGKITVELYAMWRHSCYDPLEPTIFQKNAMNGNRWMLWITCGKPEDMGEVPKNWPTHCCQWDWSRKGVTAQDAALVTAALQMIHQQRPSRLGGSTAIESSSPDSSLITPRLYRFTFDPKAFFCPESWICSLKQPTKKSSTIFVFVCLANEICCLFLQSFIAICTKKVVVKYGKEVRNCWEKTSKRILRSFRDADNLRSTITTQRFPTVGISTMNLRVDGFFHINP